MQHLTPATSSGIGKSAVHAFVIGAAEIAGMFAAISVIQRRKEIASRVKFELDWWRKCRTGNAASIITDTESATRESK